MLVSCRSDERGHSTVTKKQKLQAIASGMGLSTAGTIAQLEARISAAEEASGDTAAAISRSSRSRSRPRDSAAGPFLGLAAGIAALFD